MSSEEIHFYLHQSYNVLYGITPQNFASLRKSEKKRFHNMIRVPWDIYAYVAKSLISMNAIGLSGDLLMLLMGTYKSRSKGNIYDNALLGEIEKFIQNHEENLQSPPRDAEGNQQPDTENIYKLQQDLFYFARSRLLPLEDRDFHYEHFRDVLFGENPNDQRHYFESNDTVCVWGYNNDIEQRYFNPEDAYFLFLSLETRDFPEDIRNIIEEDGDTLAKYNTYSRFTELQSLKGTERLIGRRMREDNLVLSFQEYLYFLKVLNGCKNTLGISREVFKTLYERYIITGEYYDPKVLIRLLEANQYAPSRISFTETGFTVWEHKGTGQLIGPQNGMSLPIGERDKLLAKYTATKISKNFTNGVQEAMVNLYNGEARSNRGRKSKTKSFSSKPLETSSGAAEGLAPTPPGLLIGHLKDMEPGMRSDGEEDDEEGSEIRRPIKRHRQGGEIQSYNAYRDSQADFIQSLDGQIDERYIYYTKHAFAPPITSRVLIEFLKDNKKTEEYLRLLMQVAVESNDFPLTGLPKNYFNREEHSEGTDKDLWTEASNDWIAQNNKDLKIFEKGYLSFMLSRQHFEIIPRDSEKKAELFRQLKNLYCAYWIYMKNRTMGLTELLYINLFHYPGWTPLLLACNFNLFQNIQIQGLTLSAKGALERDFKEPKRDLWEQLTDLVPQDDFTRLRNEDYDRAKRMRADAAKVMGDSDSDEEMMEEDAKNVDEEWDREMRMHTSAAKSKQDSGSKEERMDTDLARAKSFVRIFERLLLINVEGQGLQPRLSTQFSIRCPKDSDNFPLNIAYSMMLEIGWGPNTNDYNGSDLYYQVNLLRIWEAYPIFNDTIHQRSYMEAFMSHATDHEVFRSFFSDTLPSIPFRCPTYLIWGLMRFIKQDSLILGALTTDFFKFRARRLLFSVVKHSLEMGTGTLTSQSSVDSLFHMQNEIRRSYSIRIQPEIPGSIRRSI